MDITENMITIPIAYYNYLHEYYTRLNIIASLWKSDKNHYISPEVMAILLDEDFMDEDEEGGA